MYRIGSKPLNYLCSELLLSKSTHQGGSHEAQWHQKAGPTLQRPLLAMDSPVVSIWGAADILDEAGHSQVGLPDLW